MHAVRAYLHAILSASAEYNQPIKSIVPTSLAIYIYGGLKVHMAIRAHANRTLGSMCEYFCDHQATPLQVTLY